MLNLYSQSYLLLTCHILFLHVFTYIFFSSFLEETIIKSEVFSQLKWQQMILYGKIKQ